MADVAIYNIQKGDIDISDGEEQYLKERDNFYISAKGTSFEINLRAMDLKEISEYLRDVNGRWKKMNK